MTAEAYAAIAAFLSFGATCVAAWTAWAGPQAAARMAEDLRKASQAAEEKQRLRTWVFGTVLQYRATISAPDCVKALNLIDLVFSDEPDVRRAWGRLLDAHDPEKMASRNEIKNLTRDMLSLMAKCVGVGQLNDADFDRVYYPNALYETDKAQEYQRQKVLRDLGPNRPTANTSGVAGVFPPRPTP